MPEASYRQYLPGRSSAGQSGGPALVRLAKVFAMIGAVLAALTVGIFIGNSARKRIDRAAHGIS